MVEVGIALGVDEGKAAGSILAVLQRLDGGDATAVATQAADGQVTTVEQGIQLGSVHGAVQDDHLLQAIAVERGENLLLFARA